MKDADQGKRSHHVEAVSQFSPQSSQSKFGPINSKRRRAGQGRSCLRVILQLEHDPLQHGRACHRADHDGGTGSRDVWVRLEEEGGKVSNPGDGVEARGDGPCVGGVFIVVFPRPSRLVLGHAHGNGQAEIGEHGEKVEGQHHLLERGAALGEEGDGVVDASHAGDGADLD